MSEFAFLIGNLRVDIEKLEDRVKYLESEVASLRNTDFRHDSDMREQGLAIRSMTLVLERVVNQVFPQPPVDFTVESDDKSDPKED